MNVKRIDLRRPCKDCVKVEVHLVYHYNHLISMAVKDMKEVLGKSDIRCC